MESSNNKQVGVMIVTPMRAWGGFEALPEPMRREIWRLTQMADTPDFPFTFTFAAVEGGIARARNRVTHEFLKTDNQWMVAWDDDIEATAEDVLRLLSHKRPFVAGLYTTREEHPHYVANFMHEAELQANGLLQVIEAGAGLNVIHRQTFTELARIYPQLEYAERDTGERMHAFYQQVAMMTDLRPDGDFLTEDFFFCHLCRHAKVGIFVDTTMKLKHRGKDGTLYPAEWPPIPGL